MLLLTLVYEKNLDICANLQDTIQVFKNKNVNLGICESQNNNTHFIKIICDDKNYDKSLMQKLNYHISNCIYDIIINLICEEEIYKYIEDNYFFLGEDEIREVEEKIVNILKVNKGIEEEIDIYYANKKNNILTKIQECMEERGELNIDGYMTFRVKEIMCDIEEISNKAIERYMVEKEYNEFIKLLKYFVEIQESKFDKVNIIIAEDGTYSIKDEEGNDLLNSFISEVIEFRFNNPSINMEDVIMSGLITNVPKFITIHGRLNCLNKEFIDTIKNVFGDRVEFCEGCKLCKEKTIILSKEY
ncbi:putative sporulation protein YtxC [Clostridium sp. MSJ-4]|uniref:Sporulation protein YtxC n=1 Tax=Clostridium simiarum TaxID=2841506 RepID=A0ABS6EXA2_9CLOT|nr:MULTISPECIES: putative sporulation protein YtxC [Clostridium]MBU5590628.1 putative sporulation protein YtxC [Clostridium simiarum]